MGDGTCFWRLVENTRVVNASCVNDNVIKSVQARDPGCWSACPQPTNSSSLCWINCLFDTLVGDPTKKKPAMTREQIVQPFERSFATNDVSEGGCADWHPPHH